MIIKYTIPKTSLEDLFIMKNKINSMYIQKENKQLETIREAVINAVYESAQNTNIDVTLLIETIHNTIDGLQLKNSK